MLMDLIIFSHLPNAQLQIEQKENGFNTLHILGIESDQSGEIQCTAYTSARENSNDSRASKETVFVDLVVIPIVNGVTGMEFDPNNAFEQQQQQHTQPQQQHADDDDCVDGGINDGAEAKLTHKPDDTIVRYGGTVCLTARFVGSPVPTVKWFRAVCICIIYAKPACYLV